MGCSVTNTCTGGNNIYTLVPLANLELNIKRNKNGRGNVSILIFLVRHSGTLCFYVCRSGSAVFLWFCFSPLPLIHTCLLYVPSSSFLLFPYSYEPAPFCPPPLFLSPISTELFRHHRPKASQTSRQAADAIHAVQPEGKQEGKTPIHGVCFYCLSSPPLKNLQEFEGGKQPSYDASLPSPQPSGACPLLICLLSLVKINSNIYLNLFRLV